MKQIPQLNNYQEVIFFSVDIIGSTKLKMINYSYLFAIQIFLLSNHGVEKKMNQLLKTNTWKFLGDEIISTLILTGDEVEDIKDITRTIKKFCNFINDINTGNFFLDKLNIRQKKYSSEIRNPLKNLKDIINHLKEIKVTGSVFHTRVYDQEIVDRMFYEQSPLSLERLLAFVQFLKSDEPLFAIGIKRGNREDYIGSEIDYGFRVSKLASNNNITISAPLINKILKSHYPCTSSTCKCPTTKNWGYYHISELIFYYNGAKELKGLPYVAPIFTVRPNNESEQSRIMAKGKKYKNKKSIPCFLNFCKHYHKDIHAFTEV